MDIQTEIKTEGRGGAREGAGRPPKTPLPRLFDDAGRLNERLALDLGQKEFEKQLAAERADADRAMIDVLADLIGVVGRSEGVSHLSPASQNTLARRTRLAVASWERLTAE